MEKFLKAIRMMVLILLIFLASIGIGLTGAAPVRVLRKQTKDKSDHQIELVKKKKTESKVVKEIR